MTAHEKHINEKNPYSPINREVIATLEDELPSDLINIILQEFQDDESLLYYYSGTYHEITNTFTITHEYKHVTQPYSYIYTTIERGPKLRRIYK